MKSKIPNTKHLFWFCGQMKGVQKTVNMIVTRGVWDQLTWRAFGYVIHPRKEIIISTPCRLCASTRFKTRDHHKLFGDSPQTFTVRESKQDRWMYKDDNMLGSARVAMPTSSSYELFLVPRNKLVSLRGVSLSPSPSNPLLRYRSTRWSSSSP